MSRHCWVCWWCCLLEIFLLYQMSLPNGRDREILRRKRVWCLLGLVLFFGWLVGGFFMYLMQETNVKLWRGCSRQVQDSWILYGRCCECWYRYMGMQEELREEQKAEDKDVQQCREKQPEQGGARAVSTHTAKQTGSLCSNLTLCTALGRRKTHDQPSISPLHTSFFPSATWQKWIFPYGWGSEFLIAGGCYRNAKWVAVNRVFILWLTHFLQARQRRGDWVRRRTQRTADPFSNQTNSATFSWLLAPRRVCQMPMKGTAPSFPFSLQ